MKPARIALPAALTFELLAIAGCASHSAHAPDVATTDAAASTAPVCFHGGASDADLPEGALTVQYVDDAGLPTNVASGYELIEPDGGIGLYYLDGASGGTVLVDPDSGAITIVMPGPCSTIA